MTTTNLTKSLPPLLKVRDVAKVLSLSRHSVKALIDCGELAAGGLSPSRRKMQRKHVRVTRDSLAKLFKKRFGHELEANLPPFTPQI